MNNVIRNDADRQLIPNVPVAVGAVKWRIHPSWKRPPGRQPPTRCLAINRFFATVARWIVREDAGER